MFGCREKSDEKRKEKEIFCVLLITCVVCRVVFWSMKSSIIYLDQFNGILLLLLLLSPFTKFPNNGRLNSKSCPSIFGLIYQLS